MSLKIVSSTIQSSALVAREGMNGRLAVIEGVSHFPIAG